VLIVEDNRDAAETLKMYLELLGHHVTVAFTGPEGIKQSRAFKPDVVFLDIGLPGMSGYVACTEMRKDPSLAETLFVAVSGHAALDPTASASECFDLHLLKPVDPSQFAEVVADLKFRP